MIIDTHTHSNFSHDGTSSPLAMVKQATELGLDYFAITDHCDYDYLDLPKYRDKFGIIDLKGYIDCINELKERYPILHLGLECAYSPTANSEYAKLPFESFDYIVNSLHTVNNYDAYCSDYFDNKTKFEAYYQYLTAVKASLDTPYDYNSVAHIGYVTKNSPYDNRSLLYQDFGDIIDDILRSLIAKDKTLEVNVNTKSVELMPSVTVLERYYQLGGRNICYASDAHITTRIADRYEYVSQLAKSIGFEYWTVYVKQKPQKLKI